MQSVVTLIFIVLLILSKRQHKVMADKKKYLSGKCEGIHSRFYLFLCDEPRMCVCVVISIVQW